MSKDFPDKYRQDWESDEHWEYRKEFLVRHQEKFDNEDRLVCLSQLYSNIHHLECKYSPAVMRSLAELEADSEQRKQQTSSVKHKLVSTDTDQSQTSKRLKQCHQLSSKNNVPSTDKHENTQNKSVILHEDTSCSKQELPASLSGLHELIQELQKKGNQNILQIFQVATSKLHIDLKCLIDNESNMKAATGGFVCSLYLNDYFVASGKGLSKKQARIEAHNNSIDRLSKSIFTTAICSLSTKNNASTTVNSTKERFHLSTPQEVVCNHRCPGIENLVIMEDSDIDPNQNAIFVLTRTANYNQVQLQFEFPNIQDSCSITCVVMLDGSLLAMAKGKSKQEAKQSAADAALTTVRKQAYTVKIKPEMTEEKIVSKDILRQATEGKAITEDNVGYKLLQLMGWKKSPAENSCAEAAKTHDSFGREGLGFSEKRSITKDFVDQLEKIISAYASSNTDADLVFSTEFTKEERKEIHRIAGKYALKSNSRGGQGAERHAVLSRRFTPYELVQYLLDSGGATRKYELLPPDNNS